MSEDKSTTGELLDNKASRKIMRELGEDDIAYSKSTTQFYFKTFWVIAALANFYLIWNFRGNATLLSHFTSFILGAFAVRIWFFIPEFMDMAEDEGLLEEKKG